jgi:hypothetical protein
MTTRLILQFDDELKFQQILNLAKRLKVPFRFDALPSSPILPDNIVWHWDDCEIAELSLETFAEDWNSEADKVWDNA